MRLTLALLAGVLLTAACGSGAPATPRSSSTGPAGFAQCMRTNGVTDFPDPTNGHFLMPGDVQSNPHFHSALQICQHLLGPNGATNGNGSNTASLLVFAHCMQHHGVPQFPDPTAGGGIGLPAGVDPNSPAFQHAWQACQRYLPGSFGGQQP